ncbi:MAG: hypothetical protein NC393_06845 [Clostridium sp.]|nr:hypothetical protein [Clostridium sp.]MCM1207760.1 hypothetical protein [Ruminococcus sp.]
MEDYLYEKYGRKFGYTSIRRGNKWIGDYDELTLVTDYDGDGRRDEYFCVQRFKEEDGSYAYADSYVQYRMLDDFEEYMCEYSDKHFSEYKLYANFDFSDVYPMSIKNFDDLISCEEGLPYLYYNIHFYIFVKESSVEDIDKFDELAEKYKEGLSELNIHLHCSCSCVEDEKFEKITRYNLEGR